MPFNDYFFGSYEWTIVLKLLLASLAGGLIGIEREKHGRPAGLRTHLLVAMASCLMMIISEAFFIKYANLPGTGIVRLDPGRVAAQIIAGIGFLGAGVILKDGLSVRGLTTAACLWLAAALGMGIGMGAYFPSFVALVLGIAGLSLLKRLEPYINKDRYLYLSVVLDGDKDRYPQLEALFAARSLKISDITADFDRDNNEFRYGFVLTQHRRRIGRELTTIIASLEGVKRISFK